MSTDIALPSPNGHDELVGFGSPSDALDRLARWVDAASNAHRLVAPLVASAFVPEAYKPKVDPRATDKQKQEAYEVAVANATAAVLQGLSLGLDPLVSLQQIYVVHGRPGLYAKIRVALVQSKGHEVWTEDLSDTRAVVAGRRKGSDNVERVTVTMAQARTAGWTRNDNYAKTPQDMLWSRAASRVCDRIAADVLMGIASVEEIADEIASTSTAAAGTRTVRAPRRTELPALTAVPEPEPPLGEPETQHEPEPATAKRRRTQPQPEPEPELVLIADEDGWPETAQPPADPS